MHKLPLTSTAWIPLALAVLMAATRFHHSGTAFAPADASLAVFFLGGFFLGGRAAACAFLLEAFLIDYLAIACGGVSDFCVSPAYIFLVPTYAVLWWAGRWSACCRYFGKTALLKIVAALVVATSLAFLISNLSFYLWSGRLDALRWQEYVDGLAREYPSYLGAALFYAWSFLGFHALVRYLPTASFRTLESE